MSAEGWRSVPGLVGYDVSDQGRVRSWRRYRGTTLPRLLALTVNNRGYYTVGMQGDGGKKLTKTVHSLLAAAFIGPRPEGYDLRHLNGDRLDNRPANLAYGTRGENYADMFVHGTHPMASRTHCKNGHEFSEENVRWESSRTSTYRRCLACVSERRAA